MFLTACDNNAKDVNDVVISENEIYFFYSNGCSHCHHALEYMNKKHPELNINMVDVAERSGYNLFKECAEKHNLGNQLGTPLFCMGDKSLMGWGGQSSKIFDEYAAPFYKK